MIVRVRQSLAGAPTPMAGLALGIASLGWSCENLGGLNGGVQLIGALLASVLLLILTGKFLFHPGLLATDLAHPVVGSVLPTYAMATMVVAKALQPYAALFGEGLWLLAVMIHLIFLVTFIWHRLKEFQLPQMVPSWFVPPVGIIVAALTYPNEDMLLLAQVLLWFGIVCYAVMLPLMLYRLIFSTDVPDSAKPTIAILAAPASLSLAGYLTVIHEPSLVLVALLFGIAVLMTAIIWLAFFRLLRLSFSPAFAAFTFPLVIGATALFKLAQVMEHHGLAEKDIQQIHGLAVVELWVAFVMVSYVALRYLLFFLLPLLWRHSLASGRGNEL